MLIATAVAAMAQCSFRNTAFKSGEFLSYNLYYNWKFVWVRVGTASMSIVQSKYNGQQAYRASLTTRGNSKMDKMFVMRDTLLCYSTTNLAPLYYRKGALEGKRYTVDQVWYSYPGGKCKITQSRLHKDGKVEKRTVTPGECVYDMMNIFLRARSFDPANWKKGYVVDFPIADGNGLNPAKLKFMGRKTVKADNGVKYRCLELSYTEKDKGEWREIARFFVTDDANHIPVRLDMFLKFGSAKAFLTNMRGTRNKITSVTNKRQRQPAAARIDAYGRKRRHNIGAKTMLKEITMRAAAAALCLMCCAGTQAAVRESGCESTTEGAAVTAEMPQYEGQKKLAAIKKLAEGKDAEIGVAWMEGNAMHSMNNERLYPLMSVFKLHVAVALLKDMERRGAAVDTTLNITPEQMRKDTYSPLMKLHPDGRFSITLPQLIRYAIAESDNNAADILIAMAGGIDSVDREIHAMGIKDCHLSETEATMYEAPINSYANWSKPESVVWLLRKLYDGRLLSGEYDRCIKQALAATTTGADKIKAGLSQGMTLAHKTGTGFRMADGTKMADNDAGVVTMPDGRQVAIAILIKDSKMSDADNARLMAEITKIILGDERE